jgi:hypothetical protein
MTGKWRTLRGIALAGLLLSIAVGVVVSWPERLTAEEQPFVGTWRLRAARGGTLTLTFMANHRCVRRTPAVDPIEAETSGRWWVRDERIFLDLESNPVSRAFRPLMARLGLPVYDVGSTVTDAFDLAGDGRRTAEFVRVNPD